MGEQERRLKRWVREREAGWSLIVLGQLVALAGELASLPKPLSVAGKVAIVAGVALVAVGFERLMRLMRPEAFGQA